MHRHGFFHRDLKPENVLLNTEQKQCKICDFGLAREVRSSPPYTEYVSTRWYRAPELILRMNVYNSPVDVFALGCIMAELYLGQALFPGTNQNDQLNKVFKMFGTPNQSEWPEMYKWASSRNIVLPQFENTGNFEQLMAKTAASAEAIDLMKSMLQINPKNRITAQSMLKHPFLKDHIDNKHVEVNEYALRRYRKKRLNGESDGSQGTTNKNSNNTSNLGQQNSGFGNADASGNSKKERSCKDELDQMHTKIQQAAQQQQQTQRFSSYESRADYHVSQNPGLVDQNAELQNIIKEIETKSKKRAPTRSCKDQQVRFQEQNIKGTNKIGSPSPKQTTNNAQNQKPQQNIFPRPNFLNRGELKSININPIIGPLTRSTSDSKYTITHVKSANCLIRPPINPKKSEKSNEGLRAPTPSILVPPLPKKHTLRLDTNDFDGQNSTNRGDESANEYFVTRPKQHQQQLSQLQLNPVEQRRRLSSYKVSKVNKIQPKQSDRKQLASVSPVSSSHSSSLNFLRHKFNLNKAEPKEQGKQSVSSNLNNLAELPKLKGCSSQNNLKRIRITPLTTRK